MYYFEIIPRIRRNENVYVLIIVFKSSKKQPTFQFQPFVHSLIVVFAFRNNSLKIIQFGIDEFYSNYNSVRSIEEDVTIIKCELLSFSIGSRSCWFSSYHLWQKILLPSVPWYVKDDQQTGSNLSKYPYDQILREWLGQTRKSEKVYELLFNSVQNYFCFLTQNNLWYLVLLSDFVNFVKSLQIEKYATTWYPQIIQLKSIR